MDFLKDLALPQSLEHFHLVVLMATISSIVFIPYVSFLLGSSVLALWLDRNGRRNQDSRLRRTARSVTEIALQSKSLVTFLAILPGLSLVFSYSQMLHDTPAIAASLASVGFLFLLGGSLLLYTYKYTFRVEGLLTALDGTRGIPSDVPEEDIATYRESNDRLHIRSGRYGVLLLAVAAYLYSSAISVTANPQSWERFDSIFSLLFSIDAWFKFLGFLALAAGITGVGTLYFIVAGEGGRGADAESPAVIRPFAIRLIIVSLLSLPALVLLNLALVPDAAISGVMFGLTGLALGILFLAAHFLYSYSRTKDEQSVAYGLFTFLLATSLIVVNDHVTLGNATKDHAVLLAHEHEKAKEELKRKLGIAAPAATGEDIYNAKCSACHLFDQRNVGPPYNDVLRKYAGKKAEMIAFVLNPVKVNPSYPPMPSQGLKPAEADSIVSYLLAKYTPAKKDSAATRAN